MKINFDEWNERRNTNCGKWDTMDKKYQKEGMLHLGVADMDFRSPKQIIDAFQDILDKGIFGYTDLSDRFYENIREWMRQKHQAEVSREEIVFCPRINVSSSICVETFTEEMDEVIINTPAYGPLYQAVVKNHRKVVESPLILENGSYKIDFAHLESVVTDKTKMFILCSPHNPVGRVWTREELEEVGAFCKKHDLLLFVDEIHGDIVAGQVINAGPAKIQVLNQAYKENNDFVNNSSVAYMVSLNGTNVVFLGDLGNTGGEHLMQDVNLAALKCKMVQMSHHGQNGVGYEVYKALRPSVCLWPTPQWLWDNDNGGGAGSGSWKTQETRNWMTRLGVKEYYVTKDGDQVIE